MARFATETRQTLCLAATTKLLGAEGAFMRYRDKSAEEILAYVAQYYRYDRTTGKFYHLTQKRGTTSRPGDEAGHVNKNHDYHLMCVFSATIARYRLVWLMEHGAWPDSYIQHLDGNKHNDCITNLILLRDLNAACKIKPIAKRPRGKLPPNVTFLERRGQYRVDIPGRPAQYFDSLSQAQGAL